MLSVRRLLPCPRLMIGAIAQNARDVGGGLEQRRHIHRFGHRTQPETRNADAGGGHRVAAAIQDRGAEAEDVALVLFLVGGPAAPRRIRDLRAQGVARGDGVSGHVFELQPLKRALALVFRREGEIGLADRCGVQRDRDAERTFHADPLAALDIVDIEHGVIAEHGQMHGLAGVIAQLQQMFVGDVADIHLVERAVRDRDQRGAELIGVAALRIAAPVRPPSALRAGGRPSAAAAWSGR